MINRIPICLSIKHNACSNDVRKYLMKFYLNKSLLYDDSLYCTRWKNVCSGAYQHAKSQSVSIVKLLAIQGALKPLSQNCRFIASAWVYQWWEILGQVFHKTNEYIFLAKIGIFIDTRRQVLKFYGRTDAWPIIFPYNFTNIYGFLIIKIDFTAPSSKAPECEHFQAAICFESVRGKIACSPMGASSFEVVQVRVICWLEVTWRWSAAS